MKTSLTNQEKLVLIQSLATLLSAGIAILDTVESLLEDAKGNQRKVLEVLKEDIIQGRKIADTFCKFPKTFDAATVNLLKAAEESGTLETTLKDLVVHIKKDIELSDKVKAAMVYPVLVLVVFTGVLLLILTFVIPRVATVFTRLKVNLPLPTKILIAVSNFLLAYYPFIIVVFLMLLVFGFFLYKAKRQVLLNILTSLPVISKLASIVDLTRFTRTMGLLLSAGIPIVEALEFSEKVITKSELSEVVKRAKEKVSAGKKLSWGLRNDLDKKKAGKKVVPTLMIRFVESGEKSGTLEKSMQELSRQFDDQVSSNLKTLTTLLEPALLVIIGIFVGGMMLAIIAPIYQLIGQIGTR